MWATLMASSLLPSSPTKCTKFVTTSSTMLCLWIDVQRPAWRQTTVSLVRGSGF